MKTVRYFSKTIAAILSITMILCILTVLAASNMQAPNTGSANEVKIDFAAHVDDFATQPDDFTTEVSDFTIHDGGLAPQADDLVPEVTIMSVSSAPHSTTTELSLGSVTGAPGNTKTPTNHHQQPWLLHLRLHHYIRLSSPGAPQCIARDQLDRPLRHKPNRRHKQQ